MQTSSFAHARMNSPSITDGSKRGRLLDGSKRGRLLDIGAALRWAPPSGGNTVDLRT